MKKLMFVDDMPHAGHRDALARLCGLTVERFEDTFEYGVLFTRVIPWEIDGAIFKVGHLLKESAHPILVLVGAKVHAAFGVEEQPIFEPFMLGEEIATEPVNGQVDLIPQVRMIIKIPAAEDTKFLKDAKMRRKAKQILGDLVAMHRTPVSDVDAERCCKVVRSIGDDNISFWTRKVLTEIEGNLKAGKLVDKYDLGQLMGCYAKDVEFLTSKETL